MNRWVSKVGVFDVDLAANGAVRSLKLADETVDVPFLDAEVASHLDAFIDGDPTAIKLDLVEAKSPLQQFVLAKLLEIPRGQVRSYAWVAKEIGNPTAVRAVATAVARNPIPILIPCHRVVRSDGQIGEFIFGPMFKHRLLENEGVSVHDTAALKQQCNP